MTVQSLLVIPTLEGGQKRLEVGQGIDLVAKDELVLEGTIQAFQEAHATHLGDPTAQPDQPKGR